MKKELWNEGQEEINGFDSETEQDMKESVNEPLEETDEENELKPWLPIRKKSRKTPRKTTQVLQNNQKNKSYWEHTTSQV